MDWLLLIVGILLLFFGGHFLIETSVSISKKYNIPNIIIGLTVVAFATSFPELIVNLIALENSLHEVVIGNVIGSNIANISLVLGLSVLLSNITLNRITLTKIYPVVLLSAILFSVFLAIDFFNIFSGLILLGLLSLFIIWIKKEGRSLEAEFDISDIEVYNNNFRIVFFILLSSFFLYTGAKLCIDSAVNLASKFGVSEKFISISVLAIGTNLPEIFSSLSAIIKKKGSIVIGNLLGSNIFNLLGVVGFCSLYKDIEIIGFSYYIWDIAALLLFTSFFYIQSKLSSKNKITKLAGYIMIVSYLSYITLSYCYLSNI